ncbi:unnamed protein product [Gongylonema pulchrum]|uniref:Reverse transcriptase domain-containing protein n=1 Tax=Gongylonema pulchrum TaxID=637853 RepID=A0A183DTZ3_9BILA|nr:unnamed protein product [Gongylonema pulchrum]
MTELSIKELKALLDENDLDLSMRQLTVIPAKALKSGPTDVIESEADGHCGKGLGAASRLRPGVEVARNFLWDVGKYLSAFRWPSVNSVKKILRKLDVDYA